MIVFLPSISEIAAGVIRNVVPITVLMIVVLVVLPAVWSGRPERRCASAALLDSALSSVVSVVTAAVSAVLALVVGLAVAVVARPAPPSPGV